MMTFNILSLYKKTWPGNKFGVSFLHDSVHCEHCLKGKIHISSQLKNKSEKQGYDPPKVEDLTRSFFHQSRLKSFAEIKHNSIPESSFSTLGVKLTKSVAAKLNQGCVKKPIENPLQKQYRKKNILKSIKSLRKTRNCENKKVKISKTENKELTHKNVHKNCFPPLKIPPVKENKDAKKQKVTIKKPISPSELIEIVKEPAKGTLKRKRWTLQKLKQSNLNYEDDLFENQKFCTFQTIIEESDSEKYNHMRTPQISLSPVREGSSTPTCDDCYSPGELFSNRKEAEEYIFRREKRRKLKLHDEECKSGNEPSPEKVMSSEDYTINILQKASKILKKVALKVKEAEKESDEDEYFTDVSDNTD